MTRIRKTSASNQTKIFLLVLVIILAGIVVYVVKEHSEKSHTKHKTSVTKSIAAYKS